MDKELLLDKLQDSLNEAYNYIYWYAWYYLDKDQIDRLKENAALNWDNPKQYIWEAIYDYINNEDSSAEEEAWYIRWLKEAIYLLIKE